MDRKLRQRSVKDVKQSVGKSVSKSKTNVEKNAAKSDQKSEANVGKNANKRVIEENVNNVENNEMKPNKRLGIKQKDEKLKTKPKKMDKTPKQKTVKDAKQSPEKRVSKRKTNVEKNVVKSEAKVGENANKRVIEEKVKNIENIETKPNKKLGIKQKDEKLKTKPKKIDKTPKQKKVKAGKPSVKKSVPKRKTMWVWRYDPRRAANAEKNANKRVAQQNVGIVGNNEMKPNQRQGFKEENKELKTKPNIFKMNDKNDSTVEFGERICDDLCSVVLRYLTFRDKIRLQCVSKQFQTCIYQKQHVLRATFVNWFLREESVKRLNSLPFIIDQCNRNFATIPEKEELNIIRFDTVLRKCQNITEIDWNYHKISDNVLHSIINYCEKLNKCRINFTGLSDEVLVGFGLKFGQKLKEIDFEYRGNEMIISFCPNLTKISNIKLNSIFGNNNSILLPNLIHIERLEIGDVSNGLMDTFTEHFKHQIKTFNVSKSMSFFDEIQISTLSKHISQFTALETLQLPEFHIEDDNEMKESVQVLETITKSCANIKSLRFGIDYLPEVYFGNHNKNLSPFFECLKHLKQLKDLHFTIDIEETDWTVCFSEQSFKHFSQVDRLYLTFRPKDHKAFKSIHQYLPQLTHLTLQVRNDLEEEVFDSVSKLEKLKHFELYSWEEYVFCSPFEGDISKIIENCKQIESIRHHSGLISYKTIDSLISLALERPETYFKHEFNSIQGIKNFRTKRIYKSIDDIPDNLKIIFGQSSEDWTKKYFK